MTKDLEIVEQGESPIEEPQDLPVDDTPEPMFSKAQVSKIVERERQKAIEQATKRHLMQSQVEQQPVVQEHAPVQMQQQAQNTLGGMQQLSPADIERQIAERIPHALQEHVNQMKSQHTIDSFVNKMQAAEQRYPGLEAKLNALDYQDPAMVKIVEMASHMENTGEIMKEILDNHGKMGTLLNLARQPQILHQAMTELSNSIKMNQDALAQEKQAQDPMSQLKPSNSAGMDNSAMSVGDFKKMFRG